MTNQNENSKFSINTLKTLLSDPEIRDRFKKVFAYKPSIAVLGKTGAGKSSLINAFFQDKLAETSAVSACTRGVNHYDLEDFTILDVPGIGETTKRDEEYIPLYKSLFEQADLVLWVIKSDDRAYSEIQKTLQVCASDTPIAFVISQSDKVAPVREWNWDEMQPGPEQRRNLDKKREEISKALNVPETRIVAVARDDQNERRSYNLQPLLTMAIEILPAEKRASLYRASALSVRNSEAKESAKKGAWSYIFKGMGMIGNAAMEVAETAFEKLIASPVASAIKWIGGFF